MKKTIVISALAGVLMYGVSYAKPFNYGFEKTKIETEVIFEVSIFCKSIAKGDIETVKKMISLGQDVNQRFKGMTPVMYAARHNRADVLKFLVSKGADVKATCYRNRFTALKYAKISKATDAIKVLKGLDTKKRK